MRIQPQRTTLKLCDFPISQILYHQISKRVLVTSFDGRLTCFTLNPFQPVNSYKVFSSYCTSMCIFGDGVLIGNSNGEMVNMRLTGEILGKYKLSEECLSSIIECQSMIAVGSYDGKIRFLNRTNLEIVQCVDVGIPSWNLEYFQQKLYSAGNPSYEIDCQTYQTKKLKRFDDFMVSNSKLYACSDDRGLTCIKSNSNSYIPCNFILPLSGRMMIFSQECATQIIHEMQMEWKCHRIKEIRKGTIITSGCNVGNVMVLGDSEGMVYRFQYTVEGGERGVKKDQDEDQGD